MGTTSLWTAAAVVCLSATATDMYAQPIVDSGSVGGLLVAIASDGTDGSVLPNSIDVTSSPALFSETATVTEPAFPFAGDHTASIDATFEAIGDIWTGSGVASAHFASNVDPSLPIPGNDIAGASMLIFQSVDFTLAASTPVVFDAVVSNVFDGPGAPFSFDGIRLDIEDSTGAEVFVGSLSGLAANDSLSLNDAITLPAGSYTFGFSLFATAIEGLGVQSIELDFGYSVTFVPAPGAAAVLGLGGLLAARRRR